MKFKLYQFFFEIESRNIMTLLGVYIKQHYEVSIVSKYGGPFRGPFSKTLWSYSGSINFSKNNLEIW